MSRPSVYFGGSRHLGNLPVVSQAVRAVITSGCSVHVGCQWGADHQVVNSAMFAPSFLVVFAVAAQQALPEHVAKAARAGAQVVPSAGGSSAPIEARYLLRSKAAFRGCGQAVFFQPGAGSLAVARECVKSGLPVFAFNPTPAAQPIAPGPIPSTPGAWEQVSPASWWAAFGLPCWQFQPMQAGLF